MRVFRSRGLVGLHAVGMALGRPVIGFLFVWAGIGLPILNPERVWFSDRIGIPLTVVFGVAQTLIFGLASVVLLWMGLRDAGALPLLAAFRVRGVWRAGTPAMLLRGASVAVLGDAEPQVLLDPPRVGRGGATYPVTVIVGGERMHANLWYMLTVDQMESIELWLRDLASNSRPLQ